MGRRVLALAAAMAVAGPAQAGTGLAVDARGFGDAFNAVATKLGMKVRVAQERCTEGKNVVCTYAVMDRMKCVVTSSKPPDVVTVEECFTMLRGPEKTLRSNRFIDVATVSIVIASPDASPAELGVTVGMMAAGHICGDGTCIVARTRLHGVDFSLRTGFSTPLQMFVAGPAAD